MQSHEPDMETRQSLMWVSNVHCASCVAYITEVLSEIPTVKDIVVSIPTHEVRCTHSALTRPADLVTALIQAAFEVDHITTYEEQGFILSELNTTAWNPRRSLLVATPGTSQSSISSNLHETLQTTREKRHVANCDACKLGKVGYLATPQYQEYRRADPQESILWTEELEHALHQALIRNRYTGSYARNELIAHHIHRLSGRWVSATHIANHLAVLDTFLRGEPSWETHIRGTAAPRPPANPPESNQRPSPIPNLSLEKITEESSDQNQISRSDLSRSRETRISRLNSSPAGEISRHEKGTGWPVAVTQAAHSSDAGANTRAFGVEGILTSSFNEGSFAGIGEGPRQKVDSSIEEHLLATLPSLEYNNGDYLSTLPSLKYNNRDYLSVDDPNIHFPNLEILEREQQEQRTFDAKRLEPSDNLDPFEGGSDIAEASETDNDFDELLRAGSPLGESLGDDDLRAIATSEGNHGDNYSESWGTRDSSMKTNKPVVYVFDGERHLWKDEEMLNSNEFDFRPWEPTPEMRQDDSNVRPAAQFDRDRILSRIYHRLYQSAFGFIEENYYTMDGGQKEELTQFPSDMELGDLVGLLDRLFNEHRIPRTCINNGNPKELISVLRESLRVRVATTYSSDSEALDIGQKLFRLISLCRQTVKFFNDTSAVQFYDDLFLSTKKLVLDQHPHPASKSTEATKPLNKAEVATDSGYGSYVERRSVQASLNLGREASPETRNAMSTFTREKDQTEYRAGCTFDNEETASVYSTTSFLSDSTRDAYVSAIAEQICSSVHISLQDAVAVSSICNALPRLLKVFSLSIGNNAPSQMHLDVMFFIRKYRRNIVAGCREILLERDRWNNRDSSQSMSLVEKMKLWQGTNGETEPEGAMPSLSLKMDPQDGSSHENTDDEDDDEDPQLDVLGIEAYKDLVKSATSYTKLLSDIHRESMLVSTHPNTLESITNEIHHILPALNRISRARAPERFSMEFIVDWHPLDTLNNLVLVTSRVNIGSLVVLTGSAGMAQALTCEEYLTQTWPTSGPSILALIQACMESASTPSCSLPDETLVTCSTKTWEPLDKRTIHITVRGLSSWIVETGEVLSWMGSALRSSPYSDCLALCSPRAVQGERKPEFDPGHSTSSKTSLGSLTCSIYFETRKVTSDLKANGECWYGLFDTATIAEGYPISRRSSFQEGLEVSLAVMAELTGTNCVHPFSGKLFLKEFSQMLVPTDSAGDIITWHLISSASPDIRISYNDGLQHSHEKVQLPDLQRSRHVLGWCSAMKFLAGAHDACYPVKTSNLPRASASCLLSNGSISMRRVVNEGAGAISIGLSTSKAPGSRRHYIQKLKWIKKKFVLLWDQDSKRGWLVNGTAALLHLVRTSLELENTGSFAASTVFDPAQMSYPSPYGPSSAAWVLGNNANTKLPISDDEDDPVLFQEHVTRFYEILEKAFDYHSAATAGNSELHNSRSQLEGWDFESLASERDPILPRVARLDSAGMAWIDLIRSVRAITLFGRGFGDIVQPSGICSKWSQVPSDKSYLVICQEDLDEIVASWCGDLKSRPKMLTDQVIWHISDYTSMECQCISNGKGSHSDVTQVLLPSTMASQIPARNVLHRENKDGAFIFGLSSTDLWHWPDFGEPSRQPIYLGSSEGKEGKDSSLSVSHDSGIGDSCDSTSSAREDSLISSQQLPIPRSEKSLWPSSDLTSDSYTVGIICALHIELMAVRILFDNTHEDVTICSTDTNYYAFGSMGQHNIVTTCLPDGEYGTNAAASVASNMRRSFARLQTCLFVGIGGGAPTARMDIRLGDVVVSKPVGNSVGVLQYDMIKSLENGRSQMNGYLHPPPRSVRSALSKMQSDPRLSKAPLEPYLQVIRDADEEYASPELSSDNLYESSYVHPDGEETCGTCDPSRIQLRVTRPRRQPKIHYGLIGSGNQVMKDAGRRDSLAKEYNILCFEMEAAGIMNVLPSLIIRGICDYSDSHKNKQWQRYAAATAAAYTKLLLSYLKPCSDSDLASSFFDRSMSVNDSDSARAWTGGSESLGEGGPVKRRRTHGPSY